MLSLHYFLYPKSYKTNKNYNSGWRKFWFHSKLKTNIKIHMKESIVQFRCKLESKVKFYLLVKLLRNYFSQIGFIVKISVQLKN